MRRNNFQTLSKPYYKTEFSVAPSCDHAQHFLFISHFFFSVTSSRKAALTESSRGWRTGSLLLGWGFLVTTGRAAGWWGRQCLSGSGSDTGSDSGSGAWDRPGAHWLGGSIWGSARPHKGARPLAHPSIPAPPCPRRRPPCPGSWPPAASAPSRGAQVRPGTGVGGTRENPRKGSAPLEGSAVGAGLRGIPTHPRPVPQGSRSLSRATGTVWSCPKTRYVCHCHLTAMRGGEVG